MLIETLSINDLHNTLRSELLKYMVYLAEYKTTFYDASRHDPFEVYDELLKLRQQVE